MKLNAEERIAWRRAIASSAFYGARHMPIRGFIKAGFAVVRAMVSDHGEEVPKEIFERRMAVCEACPIYRPDLGTCGPVEHSERELGCFCYMRALAQLKSGHCWLRDNAPLSGMGWPAALL